VQPSEAWADEFAQVLKGFSEENPQFVSDRANAMLFLNTARNVARDESLNQPLVLRKLNVAELFRQAAEAEEGASRRASEERAAQLASFEHDKAEELKRAELVAARRISEELSRGEAKGRADERHSMRTKTEELLRKRSNQASAWIVNFIRIALLVAFAVLIIVDLAGLSSKTAFESVVKYMLGGVNLISALDTLKYRGAGTALEWLRHKLSEFIYRHLSAAVGDTEPHDNAGDLRP
jgi:hypothetical protein